MSEKGKTRTCANFFGFTTKHPIQMILMPNPARVVLCQIYFAVQITSLALMMLTIVMMPI